MSDLPFLDILSADGEDWRGSAVGIRAVEATVRRVLRLHRRERGLRAGGSNLFSRFTLRLDAQSPAAHAATSKNT